MTIEGKVDWVHVREHAEAYALVITAKDGSERRFMIMLSEGDTLRLQKIA